MRSLSEPERDYKRILIPCGLCMVLVESLGIMYEFYALWGWGLFRILVDEVLSFAIAGGFHAELCALRDIFSTR